MAQDQETSVNSVALAALAINHSTAQTFQAMKTKITLIVVLVSTLTFTVAMTQSSKQPKVVSKKSNHTEIRVNKGLAMEDKNQFN